ncbi:MAG: DEAD/DEAH box helicase [Candidatus Bathyarchaeota archaeon]|nr:DEAD/DEAH box helicase [Candidatus Termiticorpusculum sp.]
MKVSEVSVPQSVKDVLDSLGVKELFPPQADTIQAGLLEGQNIVLASPTASGKTLIAELVSMKHVLEKHGKVIYLSPLRALASEKYDEFKKYAHIVKDDGSSVSVGISTSDFDDADNWMETFDVVITTNEKADSLLRHRAKWMKDISLVIADEVHILNEAERGPTLEIVLARLMQINPCIQILALSATITNVDEIAGWLNSKFIVTDWRPIDLREGVVLEDEIQYKDGGSRRIGQETRFTYVNLALDTLRSGGQVLVFASTRRNAVSAAKTLAGNMSKALPKTGSALIKQAVEKANRELLEKEADKIEEAGERTQISDELAEMVRCGVAYHHAGLSGAQRKVVEEAFKERKLKVLTATPTLAWGVNLPARMVVIQDYRRFEAGYGNYPIPVLDYKQMAGRAGRPKYDKFGEAVVIAKTRDEADYLMEGYVLAKTERIWSRMAVEKIIRGHVLATVASDYAHSEEEILEFFGKTFYAYQYDVKAIKDIIKRILKYLFDEQMITVDHGKIYATKFGKRVSELYIDPLSAVIMREALTKKTDYLTDFSLLHMIAHTPDMGPAMRPYAREIDVLNLQLEQHQEELLISPPNEWKDHIGYEEFLSEIKTAIVMKNWIEETTEEQLLAKFGIQPGDLYRIIENAKWLLHATYELSPLIGAIKGIRSLADELEERISKGIKRELLPIVRLEGVGRIRGRIIYNAGYKTIEDLKAASLEDLTRLHLVGPRIAKKIKEQIYGLTEEEEKEEEGEEKEEIDDNWYQEPTQQEFKQKTLF